MTEAQKHEMAKALGISLELVEAIDADFQANPTEPRDMYKQDRASDNGGYIERGE